MKDLFFSSGGRSLRFWRRSFLIGRSTGGTSGLMLTWLALPLRLWLENWKYRHHVLTDKILKWNHCISAALGDCNGPVVKTKKFDVACWLDWHVRWNTNLQVLHWPVDLSPAVYCQQCHPASPVNHHFTHWHIPPWVSADSGRGLKSDVFI